MHLGRKTGVVLVLVLGFFVAASTASRRVYSAQFDSLHQQPMFNVRDFGAKGDGKTKDSAAIQKAISTVAAAGGGEVYFPAGTYLTAPFNLTSNMTLFVDSGATILGSPDFDDWHLIQAMPSYPVDSGKNSNPRYGSLIHGYGVNQVRIVGGGVVDGQGSLWWSAYRGHKLSHSRPCLVEFFQSENIQVGYGITFTQSPFWTFHIYASSNVVVSGLNVRNDIRAANTDGMDIDSSSNVLVTNCTISTADDHIAVKSGAGLPGRQFNRASENILIQHNHLGLGAGVAIGSETAGSVRNVTVSHNKFTAAAGNLVRMKGCVINGGIVENVTYSDMSISGVGQAILVNEMYECKPGPNTPVIPTIVRNVEFRNLKATGALQAGLLNCVQEQPCQINMNNVDISLSAKGFTCNNVQGQTHHVNPKPCY